MSTPAPFAASGNAPHDKETTPNDQTLLRQERQEERVNAPSLSKFFIKTLDSIAALDQSENLKIHNAMVRNVAYYDGRMDGKAVNGTWKDEPHIDGEISPKDPDFKKQVDKLLMEMSRAPIRYDCAPVDRSDPARRECVEFIQKRIAVNQSRVETEPFLQSENQSLLLKLWTLRYTFFDKQADDGEQAIETQVVRHLVEGQSAQVCRTCGRTMTATPCPYCGDSEAKTIATEPVEGLQISQKPVKRGRVVTVRPDATMVELDLNARDVPSSSFVRWRLVMRRCDWEAMYFNQRIPSSEESDEARHRNEAQSYAANSGWNTSTTNDGGDQFEKIEGELVWLDPKVYARRQSNETERVGATTIPANTPYGTIWPQGLCVARIGSTILDLYPSNKNLCWTMCVYGLREHALHGAGVTVLTDMQDTIDDLNAFIQGHAYQMAAGRDFLRSGAIEGGKLPNINQVGIVNNCPEDQNPATFAFGRSQPSPLATDVYAFRESQRGSMQDAAGTASLTTAGAAPDLKALGTATGVDAMRDMAIGRMVPNRKLQAHMGTEWVKQVLLLEKEHYNAEMFLPLADKPDEQGRVEFKERGVREFFNSDLLHDYLFFPVEGSWVPRAPHQDKADATEFAYLAGQMKGVPEASQILGQIAPLMGVDFTVNEFAGAQRVASMRLTEYAKAVKQLTGGMLQPTPQQVLMLVPEWAQVDPLMDDHSAFQDFYQDWWISDARFNAPMLLVATVREVVAQHKQGLVTQAQATAASATLSQVPTKLGDMASNELDHEQALDQHTEQQDMIDERNLAQAAVMGVPPPQGDTQDLPN